MPKLDMALIAPLVAVGLSVLFAIFMFVTPNTGGPYGGGSYKGFVWCTGFWGLTVGLGGGWILGDLKKHLSPQNPSKTWSIIILAGAGAMAVVGLIAIMVGLS
jgi:hypothetical protein